MLESRSILRLKPSTDILMTFNVASSPKQALSRRHEVSMMDEFLMDLSVSDAFYTGGMESDMMMINFPAQLFVAELKGTQII